MTSLTDLPGPITASELLDFDPVEVVRVSDLGPHGIRRLLGSKLLLALVLGVLFLFTPGPGTALRRKLLAAVRTSPSSDVLSEPTGS